MRKAHGSGDPVLLVASMVAAASLTRLLLFLAPEVGGGVAGFHVHHLLNGILLTVLGGVPATLLHTRGRLRSASLVVFGAGLGLALDEWVLFVVRDAVPETPYTSTASVLGALGLIGLTSAYVLLVSRLGGPGEE